MSLKSFDKFCEKLITGEPIPQKEIFDERQSVLRTKSLVIALTGFGSLSTANTMLMECGLKWSESYFAPIAIFMAVCYLVFLLDNARRGSLFGVNGTAKATSTAVLFILQGLYFLLIVRNGEEPFCVMKDGAVSKIFLLTLFFVMEIVCGIITIILAHKFNKSKDDGEEEKQ